MSGKSDDPQALRRAALWLLAGAVLCSGVTALRAANDLRIGSRDRAEITSALEGTGYLPRRPRYPAGEAVARWNGRPLVLAGAMPAPLAEGSVRLLGHDEAYSLMVYGSDASLVETGPGGESVFYLRTGPSEYVRVYQAPEPVVPEPGSGS